MKARYRVHRFSIKMTSDQSKLEKFLNNLEREVVAIIPNVNPKFTPGGIGANVDFPLIVEKVSQGRSARARICGFIDRPG